MEHINKEHGRDVKVKPLIFCVLVALVIAFVIPKPELLSSSAWQLLAVFIATICGLILKPLPLGAAAMLSVTILCVSGILTHKEAFASFAAVPVWLVIMASFIAKGFVETGLGKRLAYMFMSYFGKSSLGISYSMVATDLFLAPVIPSVTARSAGIIFPILKAISDSYDSYPHSNSSSRLGKYLVLVSFQACVITSSMFLTAIVSNPLLAEMLQSNFNITIDWSTWAMAGIVPGLVCLLILPFVVRLFYAPELKVTPDAPVIARQKLAEMGPMSFKEIVMCATVFMLLFFWAGSKYFGISILVTAMMGLVILLLADILHWGKIIKDSTAWDTFIWFGFLIMLAENLAKQGVIAWFSQEAGVMLAGISWQVGLSALVLFYFYSHYLFASSTAHVSSMFVPFMALALGMGAPPMLAALLFMFASSLMAGLTHYGCTPAPIIFGLGYTSLKEWWNVGLFVSVINIAIFGTVGMLWWKTLGLW